LRSKAEKRTLKTHLPPSISVCLLLPCALATSAGIQLFTGSHKLPKEATSHTISSKHQWLHGSLCSLGLSCSWGYPCHPHHQLNTLVPSYHQSNYTAHPTIPTHTTHATRLGDISTTNTTNIIIRPYHQQHRHIDACAGSCATCACDKVHPMLEASLEPYLFLWMFNSLTNGQQLQRLATQPATCRASPPEKHSIRSVAHQPFMAAGATSAGRSTVQRLTTTRGALQHKQHWHVQPRSPAVVAAAGC
jgi:hypothetical protein